MSLSQVLLRFDILFMPVKLRFNSKDVHRTWIGTFFSLIILMIFVASAYFFGKDIIERKQPDSTNIWKNELLPENIFFNPDEFPIAFGIMDMTTWEFFLDESIYYAEV